MNKPYRTLFLLALLANYTQAQITLTANDFPKIGETITTIETAVNSSISIGSPGADRTYDFSTLQAGDTTTMVFVDPAGTAGVAAFPDATLASEEEGATVYYQLTTNAALLIGAYVDTTEDNSGQFITLSFDPPQKIAEFPTTFNTAFTDTWGFSLAVEDPTGFADSVRNSTTVVRDVLFDGYGTVITPDGSFACLRERAYYMTTNVLEAQLSGIWFTVRTTETIDTSYNWVARESKGPIVNVQITNGQIASVSYAAVEVAVPAPVAAFTFDVGAAGAVSFQDGSANSPESWSWDFGDGNTSTEQNPQHTYTTGGTFDVCLTATNDAGSNTTCSEVSIVLSPVAGFTFADQGSGVVDFQDASTNSPESWSWDFGDGNTSTEQNPQHTYTSSGVFDVCLTATNSAGSNMVCQQVDIMLTSVEQIEHISAVSLSPNPVSSALRLRIQSTESVRLIFRLVDPSGRIILRSVVRTNMDHYFDLSEFGQGLYYYDLSDEQGRRGRQGSLLKVY